jgi:phosphoglucosamine mutase
MQHKLFGTSGIRAIANKQLTPELTVKIGLAIATTTNKGTITIAHDTRTTSPMIQHALIAGLQAAGSTIYRLGLLPTPVLAFLTRELKATTGIMITASHNPPQYNGIKLFNQDTTAYDEKQQNQIQKIIEKNTFKRASWQNVGSSKSIDESNRYLKMIEESIKLDKEWRVVIDPGNGATSQITPVLFRTLGCKVTAINTQPDGFFPGRNPEPEAQSLQPLCQTVKHLQADLGIAYDGDGDRMVLVDENGVLASIDQILAAYASYVVRKQKGGIIVTNIEASMCIEKTTESHDGKVMRTRVGDVHIATAVKKHKAIFGGEPCGAWIHPQFHFCPDGILSSILIIKALEEENKNLSSFVSEIPRYPTFRKNLTCPEWTKSVVMEKLEKALPLNLPKIKEKVTIDGIRLTLENGWILVRPSGTEPLIRITVEADSEKMAEEIIDKSVKTVGKVIKETV